jgi:DHA1 family multidrug resistance protein-like MFS transporter
LGRTALAGIVTRNTLVLMLALSSTSFAIAVLSPVFSLFIKSISPDARNLGTMAGSITSVSGITSALAALGLGHLGDKFGRKRVLVVSVVGAALIYAPQALATNPMQLLALRAVQGVFMGGIMPTANALLAQSAAPSRRGTVFGVASSFQSGGRGLGPMVGAAVANVWGLTGPFWVTSGILAVLAVLVGWLVQAPAPRTAEARPATQPATAHAGASPHGSSRAT